MWRIAIVDDQLHVRELLQSYFSHYHETHGEEFQLSLFEDAEQFLEHYKHAYDVVMMDIDMPGMNGLEAARRLRELDQQVLLMFVTNLAQYALNGYEVSAIDYVLKPIDYAKFEFKLARVLKMSAPKKLPTFLIRTEDGLAAVEYGKLTYVEVQGHSLYYHTETGVYRTRGSLKQVLAELSTPQFFVCNKCYVVNLAYVEGINKNTAIVAGEEVLISRPKKKAFVEALAAYYNASGFS